MINEENLVALIKTLKGVIPANYESMERLVASVEYLEGVLKSIKEKPDKEVTEDGNS